MCKIKRFNNVYLAQKAILEKRACKFTSTYIFIISNYMHLPNYLTCTRMSF